MVSCACWNKHFGRGAGGGSRLQMEMGRTFKLPLLPVGLEDQVLLLLPRLSWLLNPNQFQKIVKLVSKLNST